MWAIHQKDDHPHQYLHKTGKELPLWNYQVGIRPGASTQETSNQHRIPFPQMGGEKKLPSALKVQQRATPKPLTSSKDTRSPDPPS